jgi:D-alanyl-D-alanine carboxypeptidase
MPGAILAVKTPHREYSGAIGNAQVQRRIAMRTSHLFQIASITKSFVGVVAAQMHAEGTLDLNAGITTWLDRDITQRFQHADRITLRNLLEHTSGLHEPRNDRWYRIERNFLRPRGDWSPLRELSYAFDQPPAFAPGEGWAYCNTGYILAGLIIDRVAGHHHALEIRKRILEPLALQSTFYELVEQARGERAHGYEAFFNCLVMDTTRWTPVTGGPAGLTSSVSDLSRFVRAISPAEGFVSASARRELFHNDTDPEKTYFLGVQRVRPRGDAPWFVGHAGSTPGYHSFVFHQPERNLTVVYFGSSTFMQVNGGQRRLDAFHVSLRDALFEMVLTDS